MTHPDARPSTDRRAFDVAPPHLAGAVDVWELAEVAEPVRRLEAVAFNDAYRYMLRDAERAVQDSGMTITIADRTGRELTWECLGSRSWYRVIILPAGMAPCVQCQWRPGRMSLAGYCTECADTITDRRFRQRVIEATRTEEAKARADAATEARFTAAMAEAEAEAEAIAESDELMVAHGAGYAATLTES